MIPIAPSLSKKLPSMDSHPNAEFTSFHGDDQLWCEFVLQIKESSIETGAFAGRICNRIANIDGQGTVGFSDCRFRAGERMETGLQFSSFRQHSDQGCEFRKKAACFLGKRVDRAVVTGNFFPGLGQKT